MHLVIFGKKIARKLPTEEQVENLGGASENARANSDLLKWVRWLEGTIYSDNSHKAEGMCWFLEIRALVVVL